MKKIHIIIACIVIVILTTLFYLTRSTTLPPLSVINTVPKDGTSQNPYNSISVTFNRAPLKDEFTITIEPQTAVTVSEAQNNTIQIKPVSTFLASTKYTISINMAKKTIFHFETEQIGSNPPGWNEAFDQTEKIYHETEGKQNEALMAIRNSLPIKKDGFSIEYSYKNNTYTVTLSAPYETSKNQFLTWIKQQGVTNISAVRINFLNK